MNKRFEELAYSVGISVEYLTNTKQIVLIERFAELIVKDTLNVLCEKMDEHHVDLSNLPAWDKAQIATEKHFGVEE